MDDPDANVDLSDNRIKSRNQILEKSYFGYGEKMKKKKINEDDDDDDDNNGGNDDDDDAVSFTYFLGRWNFFTNILEAQRPWQ